MSFLAKLKKKIEDRYYGWDDEDTEEYSEEGIKEGKWDKVVYSREHVNIHDRNERHEYVVSCLEQIAEAGREVDSLSYEYNMVTAYLRDMEEIEALPAGEKELLEAAALKVSGSRRDKTDVDEQKVRMSDEKFRQFATVSEDAADGIRKLTEAEKYQQLIKGDLKKLDNERQAYRYRRNELLGTIEDCQGMGVVCTVAIIICMTALLVLKYAFKMNTTAGVIIATVAAAVFYLYIFLKYHEASAELKSVVNATNRLIQLQNRVKIRYVNNTNLLDYLCMKYRVNSSKELAALAEQYEAEKTRREAYRHAQLELDACESDLLKILRKYQISDPAIWLKQPEALTDHKEMVEIRHNLIVRRQSLRKRMDYNREVIAHNAQNEIRDLVESYPRYASEILALVDEYDARSGGQLS